MIIFSYTHEDYVFVVIILSKPARVYSYRRARVLIYVGIQYPYGYYRYACA